MRASFNGARRNLAAAYNELYRRHPEIETDEWCDLHNAIVGLLCMYDPNVDGDLDDLIEVVRLPDLDGE